MQHSNDETPSEEGTRSPEAQPRGVGPGPEGAPPCNTAPANCNNTETVQILGQGIDSLYLSYPGQVYHESELKLQVLKETAQSRNPQDNALAVFALGMHRFEVLGKGAGYYPYVLVDNAFRIKVSSAQAVKFPLAYIQIFSGWLLANGVNPVVQELDALMSALGQLDDVAQVSRADMYVDFVTEMPLDVIPTSHWVTRAKSIHQYSMYREFTGYSIGLGGDICARLYDKTAEIRESKKEYMQTIWKEKGWNGMDRVYRLEFQLERKTLVEHQTRTVPELLLNLGQLWRYGTLNWLKLTIPSESDSTQSRWPIHPVWEALANLPWPDTLDRISLPVRSSRIPDATALYVRGLSGITSLMAVEGITDPLVAFDTYYDNAKNYHNERAWFTGTDFPGYLQDKAALKAKYYNLTYPEVDERRDEKIRDAYAREYRKLKDGE